MTDVLFIVPRKNYDKDARKFKRMEASFPMGILSLGSVLKKEGLNVGLLDTNALFMSLEETLAKIKELKPKVIGIVAFSEFIRGTVQLAETIRLGKIDSVITVGGPHITASPDFCENFSVFDIAIMGEAELTYVKIVNEIMHGKTVRGMFKGDLIENLDTLPIPDRDIIDEETRNIYYSGSYKGLEKVNIHTSRGCPSGCIFCCSFNKKVRYHSPERVVREIELCVDKYGTRAVSFTDDNFTLKKDRVFEICGLLKKRKIK